jgi:hypothetical protein
MRYDERANFLLNEVNPQRTRSNFIKNLVPPSLNSCGIQVSARDCSQYRTGAVIDRSSDSVDLKFERIDGALKRDCSQIPKVIIAYGFDKDRKTYIFVPVPVGRQVDCKELVLHVPPWDLSVNCL